MKRTRLTFMTLAFLLFGTLFSQISVRAESQPFQMVKNPMIYFVMLDRFANGDPANDSGYLSGGATKSGFNPLATGFYHGGDLAGLTSKISYIKSLGFNAIWVTPVVRQVTVAPDESSAGYHGYWGAGFNQVDSHLGTMQDFKDFVSAAHDQGLGVILDIVVNHTGDVIYSSAGTGYSDTDFFPYLLKNGKEFDATKLAGSTKFPKLSQLNPDTSFPNPPLLNNSDSRVKTPAWLNDVRNYHNRGNTTFTGESSQFGDFFGLDDLFTESPVVVKGMTQIFADWITNTGVDGFRVDTAKHVNEKFWKSFLPAMRKAAAKQGKTNFPMWGEVYDADESQTSYWVKNASFNEVLDFPLQSQLLSFINTGSTNGLVSVLNGDDSYTTATSNANQLVTFLGNHDMGRVGSFITRATNDKALQLARVKLAHALLFTLRGNPAVYYGDEFGLGGGGDQQARQDLFPTQVIQWKTEARIGGTPIGSGSSFDSTNPIQDTIKEVTALRSSDSAFTAGPQIIRLTGSGILAFSRINPDTGIEYLCVFNSGNSAIDKNVTVGATNSNWSRVLGEGSLNPDVASVKVQVPKNSWGIFKSGSATPTAENISIKLDPIRTSAYDSNQYQLQAKVTNTAYQQVRFYRKAPAGKWTYLGSDNSPIYSAGTSSQTLNTHRIFPLRSSLKRATTYAYKAEVVMLNGEISTSKILSYRMK